MNEKELNRDIAVEHLRSKCRSVSERTTALYPQLRYCLTHYDYEKARQVFEELVSLHQLKQDIGTITAGLEEEVSSVPTFLVSAELLYQVYLKLREVQTESIMYASGVRYGSFLTVERLVPVDLEASEYGYASASIGSTSRVLARLEQFGSVLTCYFHAHPGKGPSSNHPSNIDIANQARLETGGYRTIGGIFSRDGYLRFFSDKMESRVELSGKGIENVGPNLYRLTQA